MGLTSLWDYIYRICRFHGWYPNHLQDVQFNAEMCPIHRWDDKSQWKSRDRIYLECPNDRCDKLDKWSKKTGNSQWVWIIRNAQVGATHQSSRIIRHLENTGRINARMMYQRACFSDGKLSVGPDDPTRMLLSVGLMLRCNDQWTLQMEFKFGIVPDDPTHWSSMGRINTSDQWRQQRATVTGEP